MKRTLLILTCVWFGQSLAADDPWFGAGSLPTETATAFSGSASPSAGGHVITTGSDEGLQLSENRATRILEFDAD